MASNGDQFGNQRRCEICRVPVSGEFLPALGGLCHSKCLVCSSCKKEIQDGSEMKIDKAAKMQCLQCFNTRSEVKSCNICDEPINEVLQKPIISGGKTFHQNCFKCKGCEAPLSPGWNYEFRNHLFCNGKCILRYDQSAMEIFRPAAPGFGRMMPPKAAEHPAASVAKQSQERIGSRLPVTGPTSSGIPSRPAGDQTTMKQGKREPAKRTEAPNVQGAGLKLKEDPAAKKDQRPTAEVIQLNSAAIFNEGATSGTTNARPEVIINVVGEPLNEAAEPQSGERELNPDGNGNKTKDAPRLTDAEADETKTNGAEATAPTEEAAGEPAIAEAPKRKPGRPKKNPPNEAAAGQAETKAKRKPGRPRKNPVT